MTKDQKNDLIAELAQDFETNDSIAICDYKGLDVQALESLRNEVRAFAKVRVVKNTLANIALQKANKEGYSLENTNILIYSEDGLNLAKAVAQFAKGKEHFVIKKAYLEGSFKEADDLITLSKLPGREELLGMLLSVWQGPIRNFTIGLDNLAKSKQTQES